MSIKATQIIDFNIMMFKIPSVIIYVVKVQNKKKKLTHAVLYPPCNPNPIPIQ